MNTAFHNKGYQLFTDNWFTGLGALQVCTSTGVSFTGTARVDRMGKAFPDSKAFTKGWARGAFRVKKTSLNGVDVFAHQWMDSKVVNMLTTNESKEGTVERKVVDKKTRNFSRQQVPQPTIYALYNYGKVGTDRMDQVVGDNYRNTKFRWHVKIMLHVVYMAMANAWVTYRQVETHQQHLKLHEFSSRVVLELKVGLMKPQEATGPVVSASHTPWKAARQTGEYADTGEYGKRKRVKRNRPKCKLCHACTQYKCLECDVYLCVATSEQTEACWTHFHTQ
jgi:hypothetical protein